MNSKQSTKTSKFLSLVLRHQPEVLGITLDAAGWVDVAELLEAMNKNGTPLTAAELHELVAASDKRRFALSEDGLRIRASQGHSVEVDFRYEPATPPDVLFHGTVDRFLLPIREKGRIKGARHHVHLSSDVRTAEQVGQRRGRPVVLIVQSTRMRLDGHDFFLSANGVWLTAHVPPEYLEFP